MSIRVRFMILMAVLCLIASLTLAAASYSFNVHKTVEEARAKGNIVFNYMRATRDFFQKHQLPAVYETAGREEFIPELMSSFAVVRGVFSSFSKIAPNYIFKQATKNPLVPGNKADSQELEIIKQFQENQKLASSEGQIMKNDSTYYYFAQPIHVRDKGCLECHGDPQDAPEEQLDIYGEKNGYNWKVGETVSTLIVYVPIQKDLDKAMKLSGMLFLIGTAGIAALMLIIWIFFNSYVVKPLIKLEERATEISLGRNLDTSIEIQTRDEIGSLGRAIDRLRISVHKLLMKCR